MLSIALRTILTRWRLFLGTFIALTFGIAVMAGMFNVLIAATAKPTSEHSFSRYAAASIIIAADQKLHTPAGDDTAETVTLKDRRMLDSATSTAIATVPGIERVVIDRSFPAAIAGDDATVTSPADKPVGHGWSSAQLTPFLLESGTAPTTGQVVITKTVADTAHIQPGQAVTIVTPVGLQQFTVSGIAKLEVAGHLSGENTIFFDDAQAAKLSGVPGKADAIAILAKDGQDIGRLRTAVAAALPDNNLQVLTGQDKGGDVAAAIRTEALNPVIELAGFNIGVAGFVCIFVIAGTASFAITQRRQEIALLRLIGAMPRQIRRMILDEVLIVALLAAVVGSLVGAACSVLFASILVRYGVAPPGFAASGTVLGSLAASAIGVVVAITGILLASRRASNVRPAEAMRDAAAEQKVMTGSRWFVGLLFIAISIGLVVFLSTVGGFAAIAVSILVTELLAIALALLMPIFINPVVTIITAPLIPITTAVGILSRANLRNAVRRTTSTAAPILVAVSVTISIVGVSAASSAADQLNTEHRTLATHVVSAGSSPIPANIIPAIQALPGVNAASGIQASTLYPVNDIFGDEEFGIMHADLTKLFKIDVKEGSLGNLGNNGIAVEAMKAQDLGWKLGQELPVFLSDGSKVSLHIAAIVNMPAILPEILVQPSLIQNNGDTTMTDTIYVKATNNTSVQQQLEDIVKPMGAQVQITSTWLADRQASGSRDSQAILMLLLGLALIYLAIAIANTLLMAASSRVNDISLLRDMGASNRQILGMITCETIIAVVTGSVLGILAAGWTILGVYYSLRATVPDVPLFIIEPAYFLVIGGSLVIALLASIIPASLYIRKRQNTTKHLT